MDLRLDSESILDMTTASLLLFVFFIAIIILRLYLILPRNRAFHKATKRKSKTCSLAVFLGSGGHTTEALTLVSALDFSRYTPRTYIICQGDTLSAQKVISLELDKGPSPRNGTPCYSVLTIPRARHVHQPLYTTLSTALWSLLASINMFTLLPFFRAGQPGLSDILLVNGPGTCFIICIVVYLNKFFGLSSPQMIYVESFARAQSLSLSGKLLRPLVDRFVVQWPTLARTNQTQVEYGGWLV